MSELKRQLEERERVKEELAQKGCLAARCTAVAEPSSSSHQDIIDTLVPEEQQAQAKYNDQSFEFRNKLSSELEQLELKTQAKIKHDLREKYSSAS